jgi:ubiquitin-like 1-activating enzyme E1 B
LYSFLTIGTIRSTPSEPIHCIVWAKSYLFSHLFGRDEEDEINNASDETNASEIKRLNSEADELKKLKSSIGNKNCAETVFKKVFNRDISKLLKMTELWETRSKPIILTFAKLKASLKKFNMPNFESLEFDQKEWTLEHNFAMLLSRFIKV